MERLPILTWGNGEWPQILRGDSDRTGAGWEAVYEMRPRLGSEGVMPETAEQLISRIKDEFVRVFRAGEDLVDAWRQFIRSEEYRRILFLRGSIKELQIYWQALMDAKTGR